MYEALEEPVEWVPCAPMFVETDDGFALTDAAREILDPPQPAPLSVVERVAALRRELGELAAVVPAAAREWATHELTDAVEVLHEATNLLGACETAVIAQIDRQGGFEQ